MDPDSRPGPATAGPLHIILADKTWRRLVPRAETLIRRAAKAADTSLSLGEKALDAGTTGPHPKERTVLLTSDPEIRRLNRTYRGKDKPTNVLTFESGDIALACGTIRREAAAAGKPVAHHLAHLVVHGALHLRGHDHAGAGEARRMEMAEARALHRLRVPNPWRTR